MKTLKELSKGVFGPKKIRWKEKKLRKFFFSFVWSAEKKKEKKYDRKLDGKFGKINGKNFPHILVRKTVEKKASTDPEPLLSSAALNLARHRPSSISLDITALSLSLLLSPRRALADNATSLSSGIPLSLIERF